MSLLYCIVLFALDVSQHGFDAQAHVGYLVLIGTPVVG